MSKHSSPESDPVFEDWRILMMRLESSGQRLIVPLSAERATGLYWAEDLRQRGELLVLSDRDDLAGAQPLDQAANLLGREADHVLFDAFDRFPVDALCIAAGLVRSGGALLVLLPPEGLPPQDPDGRWQDQQGEPRFIRYLFDALQARQALWRPGEPVPLLPRVEQTTFFGDLTDDQEWAFDWLLRDWPEVGPERVLVAADRGRGKSLLLGRFAARLETPVVVTAASRRQAGMLLEQLPPERRHFVAPDELIRRGERIGLLLVDEAAMLPYGLLEDCLNLADRALLATTLNGYEGTGQGFRLRFLRDQGERMRQLTLEQPVRWGKGDLLEAGLNQALLLHSDELPEVDEDAETRIEAVTGQQLLEDGARLHQAHELMLAAHYRYRPSDLRQWLEDPNQRLYLALRGDTVAGLLQINAEGGLGEETAEAVFRGERRPQGHLLAQMLTAQAGWRGFARHRGWRVQRIAVRDDLRRQGIGRALIEQAMADAREQGMDWFGSSFALDAAVTPFWRALGFPAVHLGRGRGKSSGRQAVAVLRSLDAQLEQPLAALGQRLVRNLPLNLLGYGKTLRVEDVDGLIRLLPEAGLSPDPLQMEVLDAVIDGRFGLELARADLAPWLIAALAADRELPGERRQRLIDTLLLGREAEADDGRKARDAALRADLAVLRATRPYREA